MTRSMQKNGYILAAFALVTSGLIALTDFFTSPVIQQQQRNELQKTLNSIIPPHWHDNDLEHDCTLVVNSELLGNAEPKTVYRARLDGQPQALAIETMTPNGYSGNIRLIVGVGADGIISGVRVLEHRETPGLGDKIERRISDWILSFDGKSLTDSNQKSWAVRKDGGDFDQFTGATITPRAVVESVRKALVFVTQRQSELYQAGNQCLPQNPQESQHE
ncbi:electron transport complex subunit RsxG [Lacimicrobium alkaliphilum]|uniref:Ion-translocating oxidoreductase complex subunit G n=1 Tax=Lacimicrobium alkaliphilum TaxID=1526571 RepID=A0A0U3AIG3_9ALTE|nr:electron transport complex subunit RsxG [Lacimicrobium alkaliphilum]ALS97794.1 electron transport complex subunit G [Lacimicrobium alkaliphilum]